MPSYLNSSRKTDSSSRAIVQVSAIAEGAVFRPAESLEQYELDRRNGSILRKVSRPDDVPFITRIDTPKSVSRKQDLRAIFDQSYLRSKTGLLHKPLRGGVRVADLFSGCGGLSLGVREACTALGQRFEPVLAIDQDEASLEVYKRNFKPTYFYKSDIWKLLTGDVDESLGSEEKALKKKIGMIDFLLAGPPCQGNSDLNNHTRRNDKRNHLYERVARFAEVAEPNHLIIENIPTVIHGKDRSLDNTIRHLERLGYTCDSQIVNLASLGVPQRRKRHLLLASTKTAVSIADIISKHKVIKERSLRWAIEDLECETSAGIFRTPSVLSKENLRRIDYLMKTGKYDLPNAHRPVCHQDEHSYVSMYGRLNYDAPAQTITSGFGSPGQGRYIHPTQRRTLFPHEAARIQFFPDSFDFSSVTLRTSLANMLGNAVPMLLAYVFCVEMLITCLPHPTGQLG